MGFRTPGAHRSIFGLILPNNRNMLKTMLWSALLVATSLLNTHQNWIQIGRVIHVLLMRKILYTHIWAYIPILIDFSPLIGQLSIFLDETNFI